MHLLGNCLVILGFSALGVAGFFSVLKDLLSRDLFGAPSWSNEKCALEAAEAARVSRSANWILALDPGSRGGKSLGHGFLDQLIENDHGAKGDEQNGDAGCKERAHKDSN
jgi:hypothetical protein